MRLLSNTNFECFKQILASSCIYFQQGFVWFTSYAGMKKKPFDAAVNLTCERKKKIHAALKFQAGVNFISDTCKHPLTRWNIHSVLQDSMFAYLVWLWFIWWSRLTNEPRKPWRTLKTPGKNYPLKKFMETQGHFFGFWRNIENSILKRKKLIKNKIKFRFCRSYNCLLQRQVFYKAGKSVKKMSFSLDIVKKFENPVRNGQGFITLGRLFVFAVFLKFGKILVLCHWFIILFWW